MNAAEYGQPDAEDAKVTQRTQKEQPEGEHDFSHAIIGAAVEVQRVLGVGLLESAYSAALVLCATFASSASGCWVFRRYK